MMEGTRLFFGVCVLTLSLIARGADAQAHFFDITRTNELGQLEPRTRALKTIEFLREEVTRPSSRGRDAATGTLIDTHDKLGQIIARSALSRPDLTVLREESERMPDGRLKDLVMILRAWVGDQQVFEPVLAFFADPQNHKTLREVAADGLRAIPDKRAVPVAVKILVEDTALRTTVRKVPGYARPRGGYFYVVRDAALRLLQALDKAEIALSDDVRDKMDNAILQSEEAPEGEGP